MIKRKKLKKVLLNINISSSIKLNFPIINEIFYF